MFPTSNFEAVFLKRAEFCDGKGGSVAGWERGGGESTRAPFERETSEEEKRKGKSGKQIK